MHYIRLLCRHIVQCTLRVLSVLWLYGLFGLAGDLDSPSQSHTLSNSWSPRRHPWSASTLSNKVWRVGNPLGRWVVEEMRGAPSGKRVLVQRAVDNPL